MRYESGYGTSDTLVASRPENLDSDDIAFKLEKAREIVDSGDLGRLAEALKLKREALGIEKLPPGGEAAWFNLDAEPEMNIGASALDDRGYVRWTGDEQYYPSLHTTTLSRHASRIATDRLFQAISDPEASVEPLPGHIWDDRDAQSEAIKTVYVQEGTWREFEGYVFMRLGGELRMAPDGPALRQALQEAQIKEEGEEAPRGIRISFHPSYQMPVERIGYNPRDEIGNWKLHPRVAKVENYWHEEEYKFALQREAEIRTDDTMAPSKREEALEQLSRPEMPGELSPQAEVIVVLRAIQNLQGSSDSPSADPELLAGIEDKIKATLRRIIERAAPVQRGEEYDGTNPGEIPGYEGANDPTQYIPTIGSAAVGLAATRVIDMEGAQDGDTRVYGGDEEVFAPDDQLIEELTPSEKRVVRLALEWQVKEANRADRPDLYKEAADVLEHGGMLTVQ